MQQDNLRQLSVVIVAYKAAEALKRCIKSIGKGVVKEVLVVDNNKHNRGFARGCNIGAKKAKGKYLLFLNPDTQVSRRGLKLMVEKLASSQRIAIVAPQLTDEAGRGYLSYTAQISPLSALVVLSVINKWWPNNEVSRRYWYKNDSINRAKYVEAASGAALLMERKEFLKMGGFDERFFMYWEDMDLCRRVLGQGQLIYFLPQAKIKHIRELSSKLGRSLKWFKRSRWLFFRKHFGMGMSYFLEGFLRLGEGLAQMKKVRVDFK